MNRCFSDLKPAELFYIVDNGIIKNYKYMKVVDPFDDDYYYYVNTETGVLYRGLYEASNFLVFQELLDSV